MSEPQSCFAFTKLVVADLEKTSAFYRDVLGLSELARVESDITRRKISEIILGNGEGASFILLAYLDAPKPASGEVILGITTPDAAAFVRRAVMAGGSVAQDVYTTHQMGNDLKVGFVADPEGHLIEVVEMG